MGGGRGRSEIRLFLIGKKINIRKMLPALETSSFNSRTLCKDSYETVCVLVLLVK